MGAEITWAIAFSMFYQTGKLIAFDDSAWIKTFHSASRPYGLGNRANQMRKRIISGMHPLPGSTISELGNLSAADRDVR
jgi:hypothetical protein